MSRRRVPSQRAQEMLAASESSTSRPQSRIAPKAAYQQTDEDPAYSMHVGGDYMMPDAEEEGDQRLYCICLGTGEDGREMIQCDGCENWFHFSCIGLDHQTALRIQAYYCDMCTQAGTGRTKYDGQNSSTQQANIHDLREESSSDREPTPPKPEPEELDAYISNVSDETSESDEDAGPIDRASKSRASFSQSTSKRKRPKAEGLSSSEDEDDEYLVSDDDRRKKKKSSKNDKSRKSKKLVSGRRRSSVKQRADSSISSGRFLGDDDDVGPPNRRAAYKNKTRSYCITELAKLLEPLATSPQADASSSTEARFDHDDLAEEIEHELYVGFSETDPKGQRGPRNKYLAKFRSLQFNLKSNDYFRSRISTNELSPAQIVEMSPENLLTPEQRAHAENIRAQSLQQSVKVVTEQPKTRITHKGEEMLDEFAADLPMTTPITPNTPDSAVFPSPVRRSASISQPPAGALSPQQENGAMLPPSNRRSSIRSPDLMDPSVVQVKSPLEILSETLPSLASPNPENDVANPLSAKTLSPIETQLPTPAESKPRSAFNLDSVWGTLSTPVETPLTATTKNEDEEINDVASSRSYTPVLASEGNEPMDIFAQKSHHTDDDFDAILGDDAVPNQATAGAHVDAAPVSEVPPPSAGINIMDSPSVWSGAIIMPEEGGYPALAVQVGGRALDIKEEIWSTLLPRVISIDGRLDTKTSTEYLVKNCFAPTREIAVFAFMPDLAGPDMVYPDRPTPDKALARHAHLVDYFTRRQRHGVIPPNARWNKTIKDLYIVPLRAVDSLPDFVELLDQHILHERKEDLLLGVFVLQKNAIPSRRFDEPIPPPQVQPQPQPLPLFQQDQMYPSQHQMPYQQQQPQPIQQPYPQQPPPQQDWNYNYNSQQSSFGQPSQYQSPNVPAGASADPQSHGNQSSSGTQPFIHPSRMAAMSGHDQQHGHGETSRGGGFPRGNQRGGGMQRGGGVLRGGNRGGFQGQGRNW